MPEDFDYSTPEAQAAMNGVSDLLLEIRHECGALPQAEETSAVHQSGLLIEADASAIRKLRLYEGTLGLAVLPVLLRRAWCKLVRRGGAR